MIVSSSRSSSTNRSSRSFHGYPKSRAILIRKSINNNNINIIINNNNNNNATSAQNSSASIVNNDKYIRQERLEKLLEDLFTWLNKMDDDTSQQSAKDSNNVEFKESKTVQQFLSSSSSSQYYGKTSSNMNSNSIRKNAVGVFAKQTIKKNETVLRVNERYWLTAKKAREDSVMKDDTDSTCAKIFEKLKSTNNNALPAWVELSIFILCELKKGEKSFYYPYLNYLREATVLESPLFWTSKNVQRITGSQLLDDAAGYDSYVRGMYESLELNTFEISEEMFLWTFGVLRSRAQQPLRDGADVALIPGLDMLNHKARFSDEQQRQQKVMNDSKKKNKINAADWKISSSDFNDNGNAAAASVFEGAQMITNLFGGNKQRQKQENNNKNNNNNRFAYFQALKDYAQGEEIFMDYYAQQQSDSMLMRPLDGKMAVDYGFVDPIEKNGGYELRIQIPDDDVNRDDKIDVCDISGQIIGGGDDPTFYLKAYEDPDQNLRIFARLLNLQGTDAFLLEALFRNNCWELISEPVSKENETRACETMISGCQEALLQYETSIEQDEDFLNNNDSDDGDDDERLLAVRLLIGEKKALRNTLRYFETIRASVDRLEYYQERRLRQLNLLDEDGSSTYDPFNDFGI